MEKDKEIAPNRPAARRTRIKAREPTGMSAQDRRQKIAEAAYYRAQARDFAPGCELEDWLQAEIDIDCSPEGC